MWHRIILFVSTIPITIAMNSFRIAVIGVLVNQFGIAQAEGFLHFFEGWIIFVACIVLLYFLAFLLQRLSAKPRSVIDTLDLRMSGIVGPLRRIGPLRAGPRWCRWRPSWRSAARPGSWRRRRRNAASSARPLPLSDADRQLERIHHRSRCHHPAGARRRRLYHR
jgi:hypothetical protein